MLCSTSDSLRGIVRLGFAIFLTSIFLSALPVFGADNPQELYEAADALATKGGYGKSRKLFKKIQKDFPGSEWAEKAAVRTGENSLLRTVTEVKSGDPENRVDIFFMGDGYSLDPKKQKRFDRQTLEAIKLFKRQPTFKEYYRYLNFHKMNLASKDEGVDMGDRQYDTALDAKASGGSQGQVIVDHGLVRKYLSHSPHSEGLAVVMVRLGTLGTGGGGVATIGGGPGSTMIHEWGHAFAGLGDEYTSDTGHRGGVRNSPNVSGSTDPNEIPWKHWLEAKVPNVGIFEGANGQSKGAWKGTVQGCVMGSGGGSYCIVCQEAVVLSIYKYVDPIDGVFPPRGEEPLVIAPDGAMEFKVMPMTPESHRLKVNWYLENLGVHSKADLRKYTRGTRSDRIRNYSGGMIRRAQELDPIKAEPRQGKTRKLKKGKIENVFLLKGADTEPGAYRLTVEVNDPTDWVLLDENQLLRSRRSWLLTVSGVPGSE